MASYVIEGGMRLRGEVFPSGNKNEALPVIAASILTDDDVVLDRCPEIADVQVMLDILADLGAKVGWEGRGRVRINSSGINKTMLNQFLCGKIRASVLFAGPLLARLNEVILPPPGGDVIGRRRLDTHFEAMRALGAQVTVGEAYRIKAKELVGTELFLDEPSVTGTENAIMCACLAKGTTIIENAACEPHVQNLCHMLNHMGAKIGGIGTNTLIIEGVERLHGTEHTIGPDYLEIGSFIGLGALVGDGILIHEANPRNLRQIRYVFGKLGVEIEFSQNECFVPGRQKLFIKPDMNGGIPQIWDAPWPQFPTDLMSIAIVVATQASGTVLFFEKMYEGRMFFVDSLIAMGAQIILCDPHRVVVAGPSKLYGTTLTSPDIRAGMALVIAALSASGRSIIHNIRQIKRGYERIDEKLRSLGARIEEIQGDT